MIIGMFALFPIHELLHAVVHPNVGSQADPFWALGRLGCFCDGVLSRDRFIAIMGMLFLVIIFLSLVIGIASGYASGMVAFLSSLNANRTFIKPHPKII
jgi:hypothetical protein